MHYFNTKKALIHYYKHRSEFDGVFNLNFGEIQNSSLEETKKQMDQFFGVLPTHFLDISFIHDVKKLDPLPGHNVTILVDSIYFIY